MAFTLLKIPEEYKELACELHKLIDAVLDYSSLNKTNDLFDYNFLRLPSTSSHSIGLNNTLNFREGEISRFLHNYHKELSKEAHKKCIENLVESLNSVDEALGKLQPREFEIASKYIKEILEPLREDPQAAMVLSTTILESKNLKKIYEEEIKSWQEENA
ncbi:MAG: hypothetical protein J7K22_03430 [Nanoarchaeota archaeon]|nr:hypothetical protein [Nanoarchaeota archaeon]